MTRNETKNYISAMQKLCGFQLLYADFKSLLYSDKIEIDEFFNTYDSELKYMALVISRQ